MPKKTKATQPSRPELIEILTDLLHDRGLSITGWPADEAAAYNRAGGFLEGQDAVRQLRMAKAAAAIEEVFGEALRGVELKSYIEGVSDAQAMTGFTDETFQAILEKEGITGIDTNGHPL